MFTNFRKAALAKRDISLKQAGHIRAGQKIAQATGKKFEPREPVAIDLDHEKPTFTQWENPKYQDFTGPREIPDVRVFGQTTPTKEKKYIFCIIVVHDPSTGVMKAHVCFDMQILSNFLGGNFRPLNIRTTKDGKIHPVPYYCKEQPFQLFKALCGGESGLLPATHVIAATTPVGTKQATGVESMPFPAGWAGDAANQAMAFTVLYGLYCPRHFDVIAKIISWLGVNFDVIANNIYVYEHNGDITYGTGIKDNSDLPSVIDQIINKTFPGQNNLGKILTDLFQLTDDCTSHAEFVEGLDLLFQTKTVTLDVDCTEEELEDLSFAAIKAALDYSDVKRSALDRIFREIRATVEGLEAKKASVATRLEKSRTNKTASLADLLTSTPELRDSYEAAADNAAADNEVVEEEFKDISGKLTDAKKKLDDTEKKLDKATKECAMRCELYYLECKARKVTPEPSPQSSPEKSEK